MARAISFVGVLALAFVTLAAVPAIAAGNEEATPTFTKDVLPILQRACQSCHRPGTAAPMALLTYEEARPWPRRAGSRLPGSEEPCSRWFHVCKSWLHSPQCSR